MVYFDFILSDLLKFRVTGPIVELAPKVKQSPKVEPSSIVAQKV